MNEQEARAKSFEKIKKIQDLAKELQVAIIAQQILDEGNVISTKVCYIDKEEYSIDKPAPVVRGPNNNYMKDNVTKVENETSDLPK